MTFMDPQTQVLANFHTRLEWWGENCDGYKQLEAECDAARKSRDEAWDKYQMERIELRDIDEEKETIDEYCENVVWPSLVHYERIHQLSEDCLEKAEYWIELMKKNMDWMATPTPEAMIQRRIDEERKQAIINRLKALGWTQLRTQEDQY